MSTLTSEQKEQERKLKTKQRIKRRHDLERWYRHQEDGPLVGWPDQEVLDKRQRLFNLFLCLAPFIAIAAAVAIHSIFH